MKNSSKWNNSIVFSLAIFWGEGGGGGGEGRRDSGWGARGQDKGKGPRISAKGQGRERIRAKDQG